MAQTAADISWWLYKNVVDNKHDLHKVNVVNLLFLYCLKYDTQRLTISISWFEVDHGGSVNVGHMPRVLGIIDKLGDCPRHCVGKAGHTILYH